MTKTLLLLLPILFLTGCSGEPFPSQNDIRIQETKKCKEAGMSAIPNINYNGIVKIICIPKDESL